MDEPLVKAVMVPVKQLCSPLVPLHVLNTEVVLMEEDKLAPLEDNKNIQFTIKEDEVDDALLLCVRFLD